MGIYKPYIKKSNDGTVEELPLDATTLGGIGASGFAKASHTHDDRYYTESEIDSKLNGKANSSHTHSYLPLSGGTLTGALNFNNNTWNLVGDDVYIGDYNQGGSLGIKGKNAQTNIGFVNQSNDYYIKLASPGVTANRTITMPDDTGTIALTKNIPTSLPASDVYDWAKASTKPSYSWSEINNKPSTYPPDSHTHSYLPLDGSKAMIGTLTLPLNRIGLKFRNDDSWEVGTFYGTADNEALTFYTKNDSTSFQFINGSKPDNTNSWQKITPALQIRNNKVIINKQLANGVSSDYNLEVNGSMYASSIKTPGALDLSTSANGIKFNSSSHYITNIQVGSVSPTLSTSSGSTATSTVNFQDYSKGNGSWYIVTTVSSATTAPETVISCVSAITSKSFTIKVKRIAGASGSPSCVVHYIAIKFS